MKKTFIDEIEKNKKQIIRHRKKQKELGDASKICRDNKDTFNAIRLLAKARIEAASATMLECAIEDYKAEIKHIKE